MSLSWLITNLVAALLLPPLNGLLPAVLGMALLSRRPRLGRWLLAAGLAMLFLCSLPIVAKVLLQPLENRYPPLPVDQLASLDVDAIVVLGSGRYRQAPEFGEADDVKQLALERLRYGALLARQSGKPLLVTGGRPDGDGATEAEAMAVSLARDFGVAVRWQEGGSNNTRENAEYSAAILLPEGVRRIALVTHAFHMPRSVPVFERAGFSVLPAPTAYFTSRRPASLLDFIPRYEAVRSAGYGLHEWIGLLWYRLRS